VNVILGRIGGIVRRPLHHGKRATLERDQVEEATAMLERNPVLHFDHACGPASIFEDAFLDLHGSIRRADQQTRCFGHRFPHPLDHGSKITLVVFER
jgi:hypothetical protein